MKRTLICILLIILIIAAAIYYNYLERQKFELEKKEAVAAAIKHTLDSINLHKALQVPIQQSKAHKPPPPPPKKKTETEIHSTEPDLLLDERDSQKYKIFEANGLWWMAQNLNFESQDSWCYDFQNSNCEKWGRLYIWNAAVKVCPDGWHLPNDQEWSNLIIYYGGSHYAGKNLKEGGTSGFNAVMSGYHDKEGFFGKGGVSSYYWSATEQEKDYASFKGIYSEVENIGTYSYPKPDGFSVRCVKDH